MGAGCWKHQQTGRGATVSAIPPDGASTGYSTSKCSVGASSDPPTITFSLRSTALFESTADSEWTHAMPDLASGRPAAASRRPPAGPRPLLGRTGRRRLPAPPPCGRTDVWERCRRIRYAQAGRRLSRWAHTLVMNAGRFAPPRIDLGQCGNCSASGRCDRPDQTLAMGGRVARMGGRVGGIQHEQADLFYGRLPGKLGRLLPCA